MKFPFPFFKFISTQVRRHADAAMFDKDSTLETPLLIPLPTCAVNIIVTIMENLREPVMICTFLCLSPGSCHTAYIGESARIGFRERTF